MKRKTKRMLTLDYLKTQGACHEQLVLFKRVYGERMMLTVERGVREGREYGFAIYWMVNVLSPRQKDKYNKVADNAWRVFNDRWQHVLDAGIKWGQNDPREVKYDKAADVVNNRLLRLMIDLWINDPMPEYHRFA